MQTAVWECSLNHILCEWWYLMHVKRLPAIPQVSINQWTKNTEGTKENPPLQGRKQIVEASLLMHKAEVVIISAQSLRHLDPLVTNQDNKRVPNSKGQNLLLPISSGLWLNQGENLPKLFKRETWAGCSSTYLQSQLLRKEAEAGELLETRSLRPARATWWDPVMV